MKKFLKSLEYWFDYHFVYFLYNGNKLDQYFDFMDEKWGNNEQKNKIDE